MLRNGSFEGRWHHHEGRPELQIPTGYRFWVAAADGLENPLSADAHNRFVTPEVRVLPRSFVPVQEQVDFFADGNQTLKIFKGWGAWMVGLEFVVSADFSGHLKLPIFGDFVRSYAGGKTFTSGGYVRLAVNRSAPEEWVEIAAGEMRSYSFALDLSARDVVMVQIMCPFALRNSGVFTDGWHLVGETKERPIVMPEPVPVSAQQAIGAIRGLLDVLEAQV